MTSSRSLRNAYLAGLERYENTTSSDNAGRLVELLQTTCRFKVDRGPATEDHLYDIFNWLDRSLVELRGESEALLLLYYSGRACRCNGQTFLVPRASPPAQIGTDGAKRLCVSEILQKVYAAQGMSASREGVEPKLFLLIVLDCPRESAELGSAGQQYRPVQSAAASSSGVTVDVEVCIIHAVEDDKEEQFGLFTGAFLEALEQPVLKWHQLWERCTAKCIAESNRQQCPWKFDSTEQMDELVFHHESLLPLGSDGPVGDECHERDVLNVVTCMCLQALEKLHSNTCWSGICESNILSTIRAGRQYAKDHAEVGSAKWSFPRSSWWHKWGPRCYLALFDRNESTWSSSIRADLARDTASSLQLPKRVRRSWKKRRRWSRLCCKFNGSLCRDPNCCVCQIVQNGFDLSKLGKNTGNKGFFGPGLYTTSMPSTAYGHIPSDSNKSLLLVKVACGAVEHISDKTNSTLAPGYHSRVVDTSRGVDELVVFDSAQMLPAYLVLFE